MRKTLITVFIACTIVVHGQSLNGLTPVNGTSLYFKVMGSGTPLLIVHGGPGMNHSYLLPHLEALSKKHKLVFYDQRASGNSATPSADSISLKFFADDVEAIRKMLGVEKLNILAHSWGALVAVRYAMAYPDHVGKMILCNPVPLSHEFDREISENQARVVSPSDSSDRSIIIGSRDFRKGNPVAYQNLLRVSYRHSFHKPENLTKLNLSLPQNYVTASQALWAGLSKDLTDYNFYADAKQFKFPVLIMRGRYDAVPLTADTRLQSSVPQSTLQIFTKSGHFVFIEERARFVKESGNFLK